MATPQDALRICLGDAEIAKRIFDHACDNMLPKVLQEIAEANSYPRGALALTTPKKDRSVASVIVFGPWAEQLAERLAEVAFELHESLSGKASTRVEATLRTKIPPNRTSEPGAN